MMDLGGLLGSLPRAAHRNILECESGRPVTCSANEQRENGLKLSVNPRYLLQGPALQQLQELSKQQLQELSKERERKRGSEQALMSQRFQQLLAFQNPCAQCLKLPAFGTARG